MGLFHRYMINSISDHEDWKNSELMFNKHYLKPDNVKQQIPKIIHQIWLGGEVPESYKRIMDSWREKNTDWRYYLWTDDDVDKFGLKNIEQFRNAPNLGTKSDIFRYEILYRYGGIYIDTDFECLKSFNDLIYLDFFTGTGHLGEPEVFNGLIASKPKHKILEKLINGISEIDTNISNFDKIISNTGPKYFSKVFFDYIKENPDEKVVVFPTMFFYPLPAVERFKVRNDTENTRNYVKKFISEKSYCVHLWYTSWQK